MMHLKTPSLSAALLVATLAPLTAQMQWVAAPSSPPPARQNHAMVFDSTRQSLVVFGGLGPSSQFNDTWQWNGANWQQVATSGPSPRSMHAMAYDAQRDRVVLHGGWDQAGSGSGFVSYLSDTWEWDGSTWSLRSITGPQGIAGHQMAFDPWRNRTVLFGGYRVNGLGISDEVWEWDGTSWQMVPNAGGPPGRIHGTLVAVPFLGELLLTGGDRNSGTFGDMWSWNGTRWSFVDWGPTVTKHGACWNTMRQRLIVRGGWYPQGPSSDTWEWDGTSWWLQESSNTYSGHAMVYDEARDVAVQYGGLQIGIGVTAVHAEFQPTVIAAVQPAGSGCGAAQLSAPRLPLLGQSQFGFDLQLGGVLKPVFLALSTAVGPGQVFGACTVVPDLATSPIVIAGTGFGGSAFLPVPLPASPAYRGLVFYAQAVALDGAGPLLGIGSLSNALRVLVGD